MSVEGAEVLFLLCRLISAAQKARPQRSELKGGHMQRYECVPRNREENVDAGMWKL